MGGIITITDSGQEDGSVTDSTDYIISEDTDLLDLLERYNYNFFDKLPREIQTNLIFLSHGMFEGIDYAVRLHILQHMHRNDGRITFEDLVQFGVYQESDLPTGFQGWLERWFGFGGPAQFPELLEEEFRLSRHGTSFFMLNEVMQRQRQLQMMGFFMVMSGNMALGGRRFTPNTSRITTPVRHGHNQGVGAGRIPYVSPTNSYTNANIGNKLAYVFDRATGNAHNINRSIGMRNELRRIGIHDTPSGRATVERHLNEVIRNPNNILRTETRSYTPTGGTPVTYTVTIRESLLAGPGGFVKLETIWNGNRLLTIIIYGG